MMLATEARQLTDKATAITKVLGELDQAIRIAAEKGQSHINNFTISSTLNATQKENLIGALQNAGYIARWNTAHHQMDPDELYISWNVERKHARQQ